LDKKNLSIYYGFIKRFTKQNLTLFFEKKFFFFLTSKKEPKNLRFIYFLRFNLLVQVESQCDQKVDLLSIREGFENDCYFVILKK